MEKHLKERLVGAGVLVAIGVILIPLLLDGPEPQQPRRIGLELPGAGGDQKTHVIRLDENGQKTLEEMPVPAADTATGVIGGVAPEKGKPAAASPEAGEPLAAEPVPEPAPSAAPEPDPAAAPVGADPRPAVPQPPAAAAGGWFVQVGSFSDPANARRLREGLVQAGYDVQLSEVTAGGRTLHRVRVGPVPSRDAGEALAARLARAGHKGRVVADEG